MVNVYPVCALVVYVTVPLLFTVNVQLHPVPGLQFVAHAAYNLVFPLNVVFDGNPPEFVMWRVPPPPLEVKSDCLAV